MHKTAFLEIMRSLDKDELKRFEAFLLSPYFNTKKNTVGFFNVIKKSAPDFEDKSLEKERIWKKLFPEKPYNYGFLKNIIYDITKLSEQFLKTEAMNSDEMQQQKNLLRMLSNKGLVNIFMNKYNSIEKTHFESSKYHDYYYEDYIGIREIRFEVEAYNPRIRTKLFATDTEELFIFDFMAKFGNKYNSLYIEETEYNEKPDNEFIKLFAETVFNSSGLEDLLESLIGRSQNKYIPAFIYFKLMRSYLNPQSIEYYMDFKNTLFEKSKFISESALRGLYANLGSALDNCKDIMNINKYQELFEIIDQLIGKKIYKSADGKVIPSLYLLSVKTAAYLKKPEFIERQIKEFLPKIDEELKENFMHYSLAFFYYSGNVFDKALEYTNKISIDTFQLKYILKNLQIIISYEKNDLEMFLYLNDAQKHFLARNKSVSESYKKSNVKFLNYTNALFKIRSSDDRSDIGKLEKDLIGDLVVNKQWLIEKMKELE